MSAPVSDTFKEAIRMWETISAKKSLVMKDIAVLNGKLKELKAYITMYMSDSKLDACNVSGSRVTLTTTKTKEPLNAATLSRLINEFNGGESAKTSQLTDYIITHRQIKETHNLRRAPIPGYEYMQREMSASRGVSRLDNNDNDDVVSTASGVNARVLRQISNFANDAHEEGVGENLFEDDEPDDGFDS